MNALRGIGRAAAWVVAGLALLLIALYLLLLAINWRDEPMSAEHQRFEQLHAQRPQVVDEQNAYVHLLGMGAEPGQDPVAVGREQKSRLDSYIGGKTNAVAMPAHDYDLRAKRTAGSSELSNVCSKAIGKCADLLRSDPAGVAEWVSAEGWYLARYQNLIAQPHWAESIPEDLHTPLPAYRHLLEGQKLHLMQAWQAAHAGDAPRVQSLLESDMRFWRKVLGSSDLLITKTVAAAGVKRNLGLGSLALRELPMDVSVSAIPVSWRDPINNHERSLLRAMAGEFRLFHGVLRKISEPDGALSLWGDKRGPRDRLGRPMLQPRATYNLFARHMARIAEHSEKPYAELARYLREAAAEEPLGGNPFYNLVGRELYADGIEAEAPFLKYVARMSDLEGTRRMALLAAELRSKAVPASGAADAARQSDLRDPYTGAEFEWDREKGAFVYRGLENSAEEPHMILL